MYTVYWLLHRYAATFEEIPENEVLGQVYDGSERHQIIILSICL